MTDKQPSHAMEKVDQARRGNVTVRSYLMEYPSRRLVEGFRIYLCLIDDIHGLDWERSGGSDLPEEKQPAARAKMAKDRAAVARVAIETLQYMESQAKQQDPEGRGIAAHVIDAATADEQNMSPAELKEALDKSTERLVGLAKQEAESQPPGA